MVRPWLFWGLVACASSASAQDPVRLFQDELDLLVRASVVQGSGARAFGMGAAFLARADDATAASWNPAGLSYLRRPEMSFVWTHGSLNSDVAGTPSSESFGSDRLAEVNRRTSRNPDFLAVAHPFSVRGISGAAQLSFQRVVSFDTERSAISTLDGGSFRHVEATSSGGFDVLALGTGVQVLPPLRIGLALNRWQNGYTQTLNRRTLAVDSEQFSRFHLKGWNVHAGVIWSITSHLNVGAVVKTPFTAQVELFRTRIDVLEDGELATNAHGRTDLELDWPGALGVGASWRLMSPLTVSLDYTRARWSKSRIRNFFTLKRCDAVCPPSGVPELDLDFFPDLPYPTLNDEHQADTEELRAGLEYVIIANKLKWPLRFGMFTDRQYFNQLNAGPPRFRGIAAGGGVIVGPLLFDAAWVIEWGRYTAADPNIGAADVQVTSRRFLISAIYRQGAR